MDDAELEDGTIFMDEEGNYYYQSGKKAVQVKPVKKEKSIVKSVAAAVKKRKLCMYPYKFFMIKLPQYWPRHKTMQI